MPGDNEPHFVERWVTVAALFVLADGPYSRIDGIECWDKAKDARAYRGPHRVIAHPPCERWGRYWFGGPSARVRRVKGDDEGCFAAALEAVRTYGGVLEHPAASSAWQAFGLMPPPRAGGWVVADWFGGWTCCVDQGHYGHKAQKATWLYAVNCELPMLKWGKSQGGLRLDEGFHSAGGAAAVPTDGNVSAARDAGRLQRRSGIHGTKGLDDARRLRGLPHPTTTTGEYGSACDSIRARRLAGADPGGATLRGLSL